MFPAKFSLSKLFASLLAISLITNCSTASVDPEWETIFDGKSLDGWTPKFVNEPVGQDTKNTFRIVDGALVVSYEGYDKFERHFGHLFYDKELSHYRIRLEYRFVGDVMSDAPRFARLNSGVMLHAQSPQEMEFKQEFPASVEAQLLASHEEMPDRTTANVCTPGTHVFIHGKLNTEHCISSNVVGIPLNEWVSFEAEVLGNAYMSFNINGEIALELTTPQWDRSDVWGKTVSGSELAVKSGRFALQAEGQPIEFKNIQLMELSSNERQK